MIQNYLREKYQECVDKLDLYENKTSIILSTIVIKNECKNKGIGSKIMNDLINYADLNKQIIALTPSRDFGGDVNRLIQFYKKFGFKLNKGVHKSYEFMYKMIRYPKLNENKIIIKKLLRENLDKKISCNNCGWSWFESESDKSDLYICHKCGYDNKKQTINEALLTKTDSDVLEMTDFVNFTKNYLNIDDDITIELAFERTPDLKTTAYYDIINKNIKVYVKERAKIDIMRSIAHELVHHKQNMEGRLLDALKDGSDGSPIENEANAKAGEIIRKWGRLNPNLYG